MFTALDSTLSSQLESLRNTVKTSELLRSYYTGNIRVSSRNKAIKDLREISPDVTKWRIYDHCAAVTRMYSLYEGFVEGILTNWLNILPELIPNYIDLSDNIKKTHRNGVGQLLQEIGKNRYQDITAGEVINGYYNGLSGSDRYELFPKAFLIHDQNLRKEALEKIFSNAGISSSWNWIEGHREILKFLRDIRGNNSTVDSEIRTLVDYRNEASHGYEIDTLLNERELLEMADFIEIFCKSLSELVTNEIMSLKINQGTAIVLGDITETFRNGAVVAQINTCNLNTGTYVYIRGRSSCYISKIQSIQLDNISHNSISIQDLTEVGFMFDTRPRINSQIVLSLT